MKTGLALATALIAFFPSARGDGLPETGPREAGFDLSLSARVDEAVNTAIAEKKIPGAVVLIGRDGKIAHWRAYGRRWAPQDWPLALTRDAVFDLASLTKPVATASSLMALFDRNVLRLDSRPAEWFPEFDSNGKHDITVEQLLRHRSGLIADNPLGDYQDGPDHAWTKIMGLEVLSPPGSKFLYSDVNYLVLAKLAERVDGRRIDALADSAIFEPLGMRNSAFLSIDEMVETKFAMPILWIGGFPVFIPVPVTTRVPIASAKDSLGRTVTRRPIVPTERFPAASFRPLHGVVHDPRARALGGVAGHAGLFAPADDLALFAQMILDGGKTRKGRVILKPETVAAMTSPGDTPPGQKRGLGWDIETPFSSPRGKEFGPKSFGHTGFTGTSLWIDPESRSYVILLTSRLYPDGKGKSPIALRSEIATIAAESLSDRPMRSVSCGIDILERNGFAPLKGKRVGLVTNHTGRTRDGRSTIDVLFNASGVKLVAIFSPEHGLRGLVDKEVGDDRDEKTGLPVISLYGKSKKPTADSLRDVDILVYDIQDIGTRFYTYISTLGFCLEAASESKIPIVVLDRPNPIGGGIVSGPIRDSDFESFIAYHVMPVRHGMTTGEIAQMLVAERKIRAQLQVVPCEGWRRCDMFDRTGLTWVNPSPNMRSLNEAMLYPGVGLLELTNLATGRGTDRPFEMVGAPWIDEREWSLALNELKLKGVRFIPIRFTPSERQYAGQSCGGVNLMITDREVFDPIDLGYGMAVTLRKLYPTQWMEEGFLRMLGDRPTFEAMRKGSTFDEMKAVSKQELDDFRSVRNRYLIYR